MVWLESKKGRGLKEQRLLSADFTGSNNWATVSFNITDLVSLIHIFPIVFLFAFLFCQFAVAQPHTARLLWPGNLFSFSNSTHQLYYTSSCPWAFALWTQTLKRSPFHGRREGLQRHWRADYQNHKHFQINTLKIRPLRAFVWEWWMGGAVYIFTAALWMVEHTTLGSTE